MSWNVPTAADFMARFARDFAYSVTNGVLNTTDRTKVCSDDLANAFADAATLVNGGLFTTQADYSTAYLYLAAHFLVLNIKNSSAGIVNISAASPWLVQSKGAGPVSVGYSIPQKVLEDPTLALLTTTPYGARYIQLVLPLCVGNAAVIAGATSA